MTLITATIVCESGPFHGVRKRFIGHMHGEVEIRLLYFIEENGSNTPSGMQSVGSSRPTALITLHIFSWFLVRSKLSFKLSSPQPDSFRA